MYIYFLIIYFYSRLFLPLQASLNNVSNNNFEKHRERLKKKLLICPPWQAEK